MLIETEKKIKLHWLCLVSLVKDTEQVGRPALTIAEQNLRETQIRNRCVVGVLCVSGNTIRYYNFMCIPTFHPVIKIKTTL